MIIIAFLDIIKRRLYHKIIIAEYSFDGGLLVKISTILLLILCVSISVVSRLEAGILYTVRVSDGQLRSIDTDTLLLTNIGPIGTGFAFGGLTYAPQIDTLFLLGGRGNNNLFSVNPFTGAATLVGSHGINDLFGLTYDSLNNVLYGTQFSGGSSLYTLDINTGASTLVGNMGRGIGGLAYDSLRDLLIGVQDGAADLFILNRSTAQTTLLFNGTSNNDSGLAYDFEKDLLWNIDYNGILYSYNPNNSYFRTTHLSGLGSHDGLAFFGGVGIIPEPASLALVMLISMGGLVLFRRGFRRDNK